MKFLKTRRWRNWQTHHLEGVAPKGMGVQVPLSAPKTQLFCNYFFRQRKLHQNLTPNKKTLLIKYFFCFSHISASYFPYICIWNVQIAGYLLESAVGIAFDIPQHKRLKTSYSRNIQTNSCHPSKYFFERLQPANISQHFQVAFNIFVHHQFIDVFHCFLPYCC